MRIEEIDLDVQYKKARAALAESIENEEGLFFEELGVPAISVKAENEWVRVQFHESTKDRFVIETNLTLYSSESNKLGYYSLHEDENENVVDDFLVFE